MTGTAVHTRCWFVRETFWLNASTTEGPASGADTLETDVLNLKNVARPSRP
jgi:hypothetical protein